MDNIWITIERWQARNMDGQLENIENDAVTRGDVTAHSSLYKAEQAWAEMSNARANRVGVELRDASDIIIAEGEYFTKRYWYVQNGFEFLVNTIFMKQTVW